MIIRFPTGLYRSILPSGSNSGNVTYTISNQSPPRTNVRLVQLPSAEEIRELPEPLFTEEEHRQNYGELIYTITKANRSNPGSNIKQFEIGERLEFATEVENEEIQTVLSPDSLEIRHDTNILDLQKTGLTEDEVNTLLAASVAKQKELEKQFASLRTQLKDTDTKIRELQKSINENNKTLKAVSEIYSIPANDLNFDNAIYQKLLTRKTELNDELNETIISRNEIAAEHRATYLSIIKVSELVR